MIYKAIVFLPLIGFLIAGLFGRKIGDRASQLITAGLVTVGAILSWKVFGNIAMGGGKDSVHVLDWVNSGTLHFAWAFKIDTLTAVMLVVVNSVSALVHWYSMGYMHEDPDKPRFFAYLSLFTFAMLMLVTSDNLVQMFFGWEGVGLASYLLIGFWFKKPSATAAAIKAFVVNRVGDFGFALGIYGVFALTGSVMFDDIFANIGQFQHATITFLGHDWNAITVVCVLLFIGAMGKSAQLGLHTWLPDAMEGPTPVSALIHAATMVTAGVFLVARFSPVFAFSADALHMVTIIGASTAFFAATIGLVQNDIKRVIAYSTCSQLGYMFFALGVQAYDAAIFHLFTHAFFKALLFLGAGSVIHAMHHEQDMRKMGGLWKKIPFTMAVMVIGNLAITGVYPFAGYFSKDTIIEAAYLSDAAGSQYAFVMGVAAAFLTSFYSWRLAFMTFFGETRADHHTFDHAHEGPWVMRIPLAVLAFGAIAAGFLGHHYFVGEGASTFWNHAVVVHGGEEEHIPFAIKESPFVAMLLGLLLAAWFYLRKTDLPKRTAETWEVLYDFLLNKWYFDELYDFLFVRPAFWIGRFLWKRGDEQTIDGYGPNGIASAVATIAARARKLQSGYVYHYAFAMIIGLAAFVTWFMAHGAGL
ncbi:NADH-quinone oxidoreductase subunit L [Kordiimonas marina]|uniref:NADH-quinone oxidoreductase subunit L n=1 Tax=Kordiimonas marina TaxID=2872312 RepID=UPI001FF3FDA8|nr:NADH-quinone oxidoreductase subunit L [Kordiimonas marina]MCJ9428736.1 NADH-quinone oxidoreductase subunit L [Kordiimonas marina]